MSVALPRYRQHEERHRRIQRAAQILVGEDRVPEDQALVGAGGRVAPGEAMTLRCVPICAEGVPAVIPHTQPLSEVLWLEARRERQGRAA